MALSPERINALAIELAAAMPPLDFTASPGYRLADEAFAYLDAAIPTVFDAVEHLGDTDHSRTLWLAQKSLEKAHSLLKEALIGKAQP